MRHIVGMRLQFTGMLNAKYSIEQVSQRSISAKPLVPTVEMRTYVWRLLLVFPPISSSLAALPSLVLPNDTSTVPANATDVAPARSLNESLPASLR